ncbi:MAG: hypothetical protein GY906_14645 [bacterium]|nr:hypothetical protein [bacterium]
MSYAQTMPRFLCDAMLGSLARWLRFFGADCSYMGPEYPDSVLARVARSEGRWLLTRDNELAAAGPRSLYIRNQGVEAQLQEVFSRMDLRPEPTLACARCSHCNGELRDVPPDEAVPLVPPYVARTATRFRQCKSCERIYWPGTHSAGIIRRMENVITRLDSCRPGDRGAEATRGRSAI